MTNVLSKRLRSSAPLPVVAGDLIFIRPQPHDAAGQLIAETTGGPYCHCQVAVSSTSVVEAVERGVVESFIQTPPNPLDVASIGRGLEGVRLAHAVAWARGEVDRKRYSWADIAADVLLTFLPKSLGSRTPFLVAPSTLDCSELAVRFCDHAGYMWLPDALVDCPQIVSPNDLAQALGVLK